MRSRLDKILPRDVLLTRLEEHQRRGERVVLANGCFDILHVGHVRYLEAARKEGDVLVVAVNSDDSVRVLKGPGQPVLPEQARAELVAALRCVDYVMLFPDRNVESLLQEIKPAVHAKGTDYTAETVPERETARKLGVRVAVVGDKKRHSTRELLARLRGTPHA